jgi:hypothetical protein
MSKHPIISPECRTAGHDWSTTSSGLFRICMRDYCPAQEQFTDGAWHDARPSRRALKAHAPVAKALLAKGRCQS